MYTHSRKEGAAGEPFQAEQGSSQVTPSLKMLLPAKRGHVSKRNLMEGALYILFSDGMEAYAQQTKENLI